MSLGRDHGDIKQFRFRTREPYPPSHGGRAGRSGLGVPLDRLGGGRKKVYEMAHSLIVNVLDHSRFRVTINPMHRSGLQDGMPRPRRSGRCHDLGNAAAAHQRTTETGFHPISPLASGRALAM
jgi:hypothetical protein